MKQDQSYFRQVFYLREDNFGLNKKRILLSKFLIKLLHYLPKIILQEIYHRDQEEMGIYHRDQEDEECNQERPALEKKQKQKKIKLFHSGQFIKLHQYQKLASIQ